MLSEDLFIEIEIDVNKTDCDWFYNRHAINRKSAIVYSVDGKKILFMHGNENGRLPEDIPSAQYLLDLNLDLVVCCYPFAMKQTIVNEFFFSDVKIPEFALDGINQSVWTRYIRNDPEDTIFGKKHKNFKTIIAVKREHLEEITGVKGRKIRSRR